MKLKGKRILAPAPPNGISFVELLVALAILVVGLTVTFGSLAAGKDQIVRLDAVVTGRILAQSILDQALHRFNNSDSRHFDLNTSPSQMLITTVRGDWKKAFLSLSQSHTPVLTPPGVNNPYFDSASGPPRPAGLDASGEKGFWSGFAYEVRVSFDVVNKLGDPAVPIDADGDGKAEVDLARLEAEVYFQSADGPASERSVCKLSTLVHVPDKAPGISAYSTF
jgi:type II secretory pathway pseudopilin PulG